MNTSKAKLLATTLVDCFGSVEAGHAAYKRAMQNNCTLHQFKSLLEQ